ncbi:hypothetical protein GO730_14745 [Spirosoma sp. HMF3257]|uniref:hypothetical protein n=1 Tax=Spirosoma telluris TaxID=2183553 RepID=UPI0011B947CD|nr:hypothetical protein [Spirosoma telluris]
MLIGVRKTISGEATHAVRLPLAPSYSYQPIDLASPMGILSEYFQELTADLRTQRFRIHYITV